VIGIKLLLLTSLTLFSKLNHTCLPIVRNDIKKYIPKDSLANLTKETILIMNKLNIKVRGTLLRDDSINLTVDPKVLHFNAFFRFEQIVFLGQPLNMEYRWYKKPQIIIPLTIDSVITLKKDTNKISYIKAASTIIHELTHFLQATWTENYFQANLESEMGKYILQKIELEAYAVGAYYFLYHYNRKRLKKIMKMKEDDFTKKKRLINTYYNTLYPWRPTPL
jgi:hypothetical protein